MQTFRVTITGTRPLLMHADDIVWADRMKAWERDPANRAERKVADDRSPGYRWLGCLYHDDEQVVIPSENIMRCLMEGATMVPTGKGQKTFKAQSQSGCTIPEGSWPLRVNGKTVPVSTLFEDLTRTFDDFQALAADLGFLLFLKRARIGQAKHIRVRPRFDRWSIEGSMHVIDKEMTPEILQTIWDYAGRMKGLCDWRPSSKTPGSFGMFDATVELLK